MHNGNPEDGKVRYMNCAGRWKGREGWTTDGDGTDLPA